MHQAVLITAYKNIEALNDLISSFNNDFSIYIHIDKKSCISKNEILQLETKKNVEFVSQQYSINWGGINHLKAILLLLEKAFENHNNLYFHVITGHDYPIKHPEEITAFLKKNEGAEYMEYHPLPYKAWPDGGLDRLSLYNLYDVFEGRAGWGRTIINILTNIQRKLKFTRSFENDFPPQYGGSTYWTLSKQCIEYIFKYIKEHPRYLKRFRYSFCSEEIFFQTIVLNSPFKDKVINDNLRFILWEVRNGNFPANLDESDFDAIIKSTDLFARKFEKNVSEKLLEMIKQHCRINHEI